MHDIDINILVDIVHRYSYIQNIWNSEIEKSPTQIELLTSSSTDQKGY